MTQWWQYYKLWKKDKPVEGVWCSLLGLAIYVDVPLTCATYLNIILDQVNLFMAMVLSDSSDFFSKITVWETLQSVQGVALASKFSSLSSICRMWWNKKLDPCGKQTMNTTSCFTGPYIIILLVSTVQLQYHIQ